MYKLERIKKSHTMLKQLCGVIILFAFVSCSSNSTEREGDEVEVEDTVYESSNTPGSDSAIVIKNNPDIWSADFEATTNTYKIHKPANARLDTLSVQKLVSMVDADSIHVNYVKISHDTMYVVIPNSDYLTQRIGSTGAENFMATTTFTLTEMKGVKYVNYQFEEGDHASPGVYSRDDFKDLQ